MTSKEQLLASVLNIVEVLEGTEPLTEDAEQLDEGYDISDWVGDSALDIVYRVDSSGRYRGVEITVAIGGPTIWISAPRQLVHGVWGSDRYHRSYDDRVGLGDFMAEMWECAK